MTNQEQIAKSRWRRIRLVKRLLRPLPRRATLHRYPVLKFFARLARKRPFLWSFRENSMIPAFYAGSVLSLLPIYGLQIPIAFGLALLLRANLATMVGLQFITNPLTVVPVYLATYKFGRYLINVFGQFEPASMIGQRAYSLVLGGVAAGLILGLSLSLVYRLLAYQARKYAWRLPKRRSAKESASPPATDVQKQ